MCLILRLCSLHQHGLHLTISVQSSTAFAGDDGQCCTCKGVSRQGLRGLRNVCVSVEEGTKTNAHVQEHSDAIMQCNAI